MVTSKNSLDENDGNPTGLARLFFIDLDTKKQKDKAIKRVRIRRRKNILEGK